MSLHFSRFNYHSFRVNVKIKFITNEQVHKNKHNILLNSAKDE